MMKGTLILYYIRDGAFLGKDTMQFVENSLPKQTKPQNEDLIHFVDESQDTGSECETIFEEDSPRQPVVAKTPLNDALM